MLAGGPCSRCPPDGERGPLWYLLQSPGQGPVPSAGAPLSPPHAADASSARLHFTFPPFKDTFVLVGCVFFIFFFLRWLQFGSPGWFFHWFSLLCFRYVPCHTDKTARTAAYFFFIAHRKVYPSIREGV